MEQMHKNAKDYVRYLWTDGTDLGGYQLQMSRHIRIHRSNLVPAMQAVHALSRDAVYLLQDKSVASHSAAQADLGLDSDDSWQACEIDWPSAEGPLPARLPQAVRTDLCSQLMLYLEHHTSPPVAMGGGHANLSGKAAAMSFVTALECADEANFRDVLASTQAVCTDMGVEMGLPQFHSDGVSLLPAWHAMAPRKMEADAAEDGHLLHGERSQHSRCLSHSPQSPERCRWTPQFL